MYMCVCFVQTCCTYTYIAGVRSDSAFVLNLRSHCFSALNSLTLCMHQLKWHLGHPACRYIKLTSPLINVVMCVGALLFYTTMVLLGVPTTSIDVQSVLCNVSTSKLHHHMASPASIIM